MAQLTTQQFFEQALDHHKAGRLREAEAIYRQILARLPNHAPALHYLGVIAHQMRKNDGALDLIRKSIAIAPHDEDAHNSLGNVLKSLGKMDESIAAYRQAIALNPKLVEAYNNLGIVLAAGKQYDEAIDAYRQAIARAPRYAAAYVNLAVVHHDRGQLDEAIAANQQALAINPRLAEAHCNLGSVLQEKGRLDEAIACMRRAVELKPTLAELHNNLGNVLKANGDRDEAIAAYRQAIALNPTLYKTHNNLGNIFRYKGDVDQAMAEYRKAIAIQPNYAEARSNLGWALQEKGLVQQAVAEHRRAIFLSPKLPEAHTNLGISLKEIGQIDEAIAAYRQAILLRPDYPEAHNNLANALKEKGNLDEAIAVYRHAISLRPGYSQAFHHLGNALRDDGQLDDAIAAFREAIGFDPEFAAAHASLGLALLARGDFREGWDENEWRWKCKGFTSEPRVFSHPQWDGSPLQGRTILLHAEQGFGDTMQFVRYAPMVANRGGKVIVECQPDLYRLFLSMGSDCQIIAKGKPLPAFDVHCPLLSLPRLFKTSQGNFPQFSPYLHADPADVERWKTRIKQAANSENVNQSPRVGLVWAGSPTHLNDRNRSLSLAAFAPLRVFPGVQFFSLQTGKTSSEAKSPPPRMQIIDLTSELKDFAETAALIANLDLVIAVDTAIVHLAGALGKPVWTLLPFVPDWRWMLKRDDSPWYPSMRLFRQTSVGNWDDVMATVARSLSAAAPAGHSS